MNQMPAFPLLALRTTLVNTFSNELILSFLFSNTLFLYKTQGFKVILETRTLEIGDDH